MRLAWFSPFPPVRTGVADCSADLVAALRARGHTVDPYPAESAHDFPWQHRQQPYDLIVYQFGNSSHHDYEWAYALRYPGLVVLHDTCLHHARAAFLLRERREDDYRAEFAWSQPEAPPDAAEVAIAGLDSRLFYEWPLTRALREASQCLATHGPRVPLSGHSNLASVRLGHGVLVPEPERARARRAVRARHGIADDAVLFGAFGGITPEKRIPQVLAALRAILPHAPSARLLLAGAAAAHFDAASAIDALGLRDRVVITGYLPEEELTDHLAACDVSLNLRWPTAGEISGAWLRALAAGVATVITDLAHLADVPSLDPRTWNPPPDSRLPITVAIDIVDEDHSLKLAMKRLAVDAELRAALGRNGQAWWQREHSVEAMADDYEQLCQQLVSASPGSRSWLRVQGTLGMRQMRRVSRVTDVPPHLRATGEETLRALLSPFGVESPL